MYSRDKRLTKNFTLKEFLALFRNEKAKINVGNWSKLRMEYDNSPRHKKDVLYLKL